MLSRLKDQAKKVADSKRIIEVKEKSVETLERLVPSIRSILLEKLGPRIEDAVKDDELMRQVCGEIHTLLTFDHMALRLLIRRERFIEFCLKNRDRLLERQNSKGMVIAAPREARSDGLLITGTSTQAEDS